MINTIEVAPGILAYSLAEYLKRYYTLIKLEDGQVENTYDLRKLIKEFLDKK